MNIHPWQLNMLDKIMTGVKHGELMVVSPGRQLGKSTINKMIYDHESMMLEAVPFKNAGKAMVDGEMWYTIKCNTRVAEWIRTFPEKGNWYEHVDTNWYVHKSMFDITEQLYIQLGLKFA